MSGESIYDTTIYDRSFSGSSPDRVRKSDEGKYRTEILKLS